MFKWIPQLLVFLLGEELVKDASDEKDSTKFHFRVITNWCSIDSFPYLIASLMVFSLRSCLEENMQSS